MGGILSIVTLIVGASITIMLVPGMIVADNVLPAIMAVTWPRNGSVLPPSFVVKAEVFASDHRAFIEVYIYKGPC